MSRIESAYSSRGQKERFEVLKQFVLGTDTGPSYAAVAERLNLKPNSVKKAVFDLREAYCDCFRDEVAQTVARESIEEEMRYLVTLLADHGAS